jgi:hypothetical protein
MSPHPTEKILLLQESELNRVQLIVDLSELTTEIGALTSRAKTYGSVASSVAHLISFFRRWNSPAAAVKKAPLQTLQKWAELGFVLCSPAQVNTPPQASKASPK